MAIRQTSEQGDPAARRGPDRDAGTTLPTRRAHVRDLVRRYPFTALSYPAYTAGFVGWGIATDNILALPYLAVLIGVGWIGIAADRRYHLGIGLFRALWLLGVLHLAGGLTWVGDDALYNAWIVTDALRFDQVVHVYGGIVATLMVGRLMSAWIPPSFTGPGPALILAVAGFGVAAIGELVEFAATRLTIEANVGGYDNTGWDLVADLGGAIAASLWWARARVRSIHGVD